MGSTLIMRLVITVGMCSAATVASAHGADGQWVMRIDRFGNPEYSTLNLHVDGAVMSGDWDGDAVKGSATTDRISFAVTDSQHQSYAFTGTLDRGSLSGTAVFADHNNSNRSLTYRFVARRVPDRPTPGPRTYDFVPSDYANSFSAERTPVLTIWPGDTVRTTTVDSGGMDAKGVTRALFGNPQTGPFFIAGAAQGDTIAIHIVKLTPNRDWADSLDTIVGRALGNGLVAAAADLGKPVRWTIDRTAGTARPEGASGRLKDYRVPLRPMLGGLALATGSGMPPMSTGDTGRAGGNMDFPEVVAGNTVYLPVQQPGALLYLGDAHARQGDGETSQYALETSMDVEFRVELIKRQAVSTPRVELPIELMALGQGGSLDDALKAATTGLIQWLRQDYGLTLPETAQVIGAGIRYSVPNLAGRSVGVAARIDKAMLPPRLPH